MYKLTISDGFRVRSGSSATVALVNCTIHNHTQLHLIIVHSHRIKINITLYLFIKHEADKSGQHTCNTRQPLLNVYFSKYR